MRQSKNITTVIMDYEVILLRLLRKILNLISYIFYIETGTEIVGCGGSEGQKHIYKYHRKEQRKKKINEKN
jgi:hypothetical protein